MLAYAKRSKIGLTAVLIAAGSGIAARVSHPTVTATGAARSILNLETAFAMAALLILVLTSRHAMAAKPAKAVWSDLAAIVALLVLALTAFGWTSGFYFASDDFVLLKYAQAPLRTLQAHFTQPGGDGFFRPIGYVFNSLCWKALGASYVGWHWVGYWFHACNCILVYSLARAISYQMHERFFAAALFAVHGTRPEAVVWIAGRFDLLSTTAVLLALILLLHGVRSARPWRAIYYAGALLSMTIGLLTKESAFAFPLIAILLITTSTECPRTHVAIAITICAIAATVFFYRWSLFSGIGGYLNAFGRPELLSVTPVAAFKALVLRLWSLLFFPIDWARAPSMLLAIATVIYAATLVVLVSVSAISRKRLIEGVGFSMLAAIPAVSRLLISADLEGSRVLYLPSVGFCLLLAHVSAGAGRKFRMGAVAGILMFQTAALWHNLATWKSASNAVHAACTAVAGYAERGAGSIAVTGLPHTIEGAQAFANGFAECVAMQSGIDPIRIELNAVPKTGDLYVLSWDPTTRAVRQVAP